MHKKKTTRMAIGAAILGILLLLWVNGAVGIIGNEDNPMNLMYLGVIAVIVIGSVVTWMRPRGMMWVMYTAAFAQVLVPAIALLISKEVSWGSAGVKGVFVFNAFFALPFIASALLFRRVNIADVMRG